MATLASITTATGIENPDITTVFNNLHERALPVSQAKRPLAVVAPAVNRMHDQARILQFDLTATGQTLERLTPSAERAFDKITDFYIILAGIIPPENDKGRQALSKEIEFGQKTVDVCFRTLKYLHTAAETGKHIPGTIDPRLEGFAAELKGLRARYPLPDFARKENMIKRGLVAGNIGCIIFIIFFMLHSGLLGLIIEIIKAVLGNR
jgi:hypothetical protein